MQPPCDRVSIELELLLAGFSKPLHHHRERFGRVVHRVQEPRRLLRLARRPVALDEGLPPRLVQASWWCRPLDIIKIGRYTRPLAVPTSFYVNSSQGGASCRAARGSTRGAGFSAATSSRTQACRSAPLPGTRAPAARPEGSPGIMALFIGPAAIRGRERLREAGADAAAPGLPHRQVFWHLLRPQGLARAGMDA